METPYIEPIEGKDFFNILLWMPNWIGDVILVLPTVQSLSRSFPNSRISLILKAPSHELLVGHPAVDTIFKVPYGPDSGFFEQIRFARRLKKYHFDPYRRHVHSYS